MKWQFLIIIKKGVVIKRFNLHFESWMENFCNNLLIAYIQCSYNSPSFKLQATWSKLKSLFLSSDTY